MKKIKKIIAIYKHIGLNRIKQFVNYNLPSQNGRNEYAGTVDEVEYEGLVSLSKKASEICCDGIIIEIGALFGLSTQAILEGAHENKVLIIDNFGWNPIGLTSDRHESILKSNLQYFIRNKRLEIFKGTSTEYIEKAKPTGRVAMVFIDADHRYEGVINDIKFAELLDPSIVCGDDYSFAGVKQAVQEMYGSKVQFIGDMWWVARR